MIELLKKLFKISKRQLSPDHVARIAEIRAEYQADYFAKVGVTVFENDRNVYYLLCTKREMEVLMQSIENFEIELIY